MPSIDVFAWNPSRRVFRGHVSRHIPWKRPVNNFGDLLGPLIVAGLVARRGLGEAAREARLLSVGSVIHAARDGDVIWGSGANGKTLDKPVARDLDVRAVRGPRTRAYLEAKGVAVPEIYGDPALLLPLLMPELLDVAKTRAVTVVPNFNDLRERPAMRLRPNVLNPRAPLLSCLRRIAESRLIVGSSLHGVIVAEALGIPARLIRSSVEPEFKYRDYYEGTGRPGYNAAESVDEAIRMGGERAPVFDADALLGAFPDDLWLPSHHVVTAKMSSANVERT